MDLTNVTSDLRSLKTACLSDMLCVLGLRVLFHYKFEANN